MFFFSTVVANKLIHNSISDFERFYEIVTFEQEQKLEEASGNNEMLRKSLVDLQVHILLSFKIFMSYIYVFTYILYTIICQIVLPLCLSCVYI